MIGYNIFKTPKQYIIQRKAINVEKKKNIGTLCNIMLKYMRISVSIKTKITLRNILWGMQWHIIIGKRGRTL